MTAAAEALISQRLAQRMQGQRDHLESDLTLAELGRAHRHLAAVCCRNS